MTTPSADQIEVSLFGPGYGECCLIHIGSGKWIIIDSCVDAATRDPVALQYLRHLGYDPATAVVLVIATHWHDDHVRGISKVLEQCTKAEFVLSMAMASQEFIAMAKSRKNIRLTRVSSGVDEIDKVFSHLRSSGRTATRATADRPLLVVQEAELAHGFKSTTTALSPSDKQIEVFFSDLAELMPDVTETESRCVARSPNYLAVAIWMNVGPVDLLLGADLEETADPKTGWSVVVNSPSRPSGRATVFKIPHHGSKNGHSAEVWEKMLEPKPIALLTPYNKGSLSLPRATDVSRIVGLAGQAFSTSQLKKQKSAARRENMVDRTLKENGMLITAAEPPLGQIRLRNGGLSDFCTWKVELEGPASAL